MYKRLDIGHVGNFEFDHSESRLYPGTDRGLVVKVDGNGRINEITQMAEKLVYIKGMLMYLNMGITDFDSAAFKKTNNYSIFMACEMKEAICQLKMIPTLDQKTKAQKGLKNIGKEEVFTSAKIAALIKDLNLKANKYDSDMEKFNNNTEIALDDATTPMFTTDLAA